MTFNDLITRLLLLSNNLGPEHWLEIKIGAQDMFTVSLGYHGYTGRAQRQTLYRRKISKLDPEEAWDAIIGHLNRLLQNETTQPTLIP